MLDVQEWLKGLRFNPSDSPDYGTLEPVDQTQVAAVPDLGLLMPGATPVEQPAEPLAAPELSDPFAAATAPMFETEPIDFTNPFGDTGGSTSAEDAAGYQPSSGQGAASVEQWSPLVTEAAKTFGVPEAVIKATMDLESGGKPDATSAETGYGRAKGLMQVMPFHFKEGENPYDPRTSIMKGTQILADNFKKWGSWDKAFAAYYGAIDDDGNITDANDVSGVTGGGYVNMVQDRLAKYGGVVSSALGAIPGIVQQSLGGKKDLSQGGYNEVRDTQFSNELSTADAYSACGPAAAAAFMLMYGRKPSVAEAKAAAEAKRLWSQETGMYGPEAEVKLINALGGQAELAQGRDEQRIIADLQQGNTVIVDSPGHYGTISGYNPQTRQYYFGTSASDLKGGRAWMTLEEYEALPANQGRIRATIHAVDPTTNDSLVKAGPSQGQGLPAGEAAEDDADPFLMGGTSGTKPEAAQPSMFDNLAESAGGVLDDVTNRWNSALDTGRAWASKLMEQTPPAQQEDPYEIGGISDPQALGTSEIQTDDAGAQQGEALGDETVPLADDVATETATPETGWWDKFVRSTAVHDAVDDGAVITGLPTDTMLNTSFRRDRLTPEQQAEAKRGAPAWAQKQIAETGRMPSDMDTSFHYLKDFSDAATSFEGKKLDEADKEYLLSNSPQILADFIQKHDRLPTLAERIPMWGAQQAEADRLKLSGLRDFMTTGKPEDLMRGLAQMGNGEAGFEMGMAGVDAIAALAENYRRRYLGTDAEKAEAAQAENLKESKAVAMQAFMKTMEERNKGKAWYTKASEIMELGWYGAWKGMLTTGLMESNQAILPEIGKGFGTLAAQQDAKIEAHPEWQAHSYGDFETWDSMVDPRAYARAALQSLPGMAAGWGAGAAATLATGSPMAGRAAQSAVSYAQMAGDVYTDARKAGLGHEAAFKIARTSGMLQAAIEVVPIMHIEPKALKGFANNFAGHWIRESVNEGIEEVQQAVAENLFAQTYDKQRGLFEDAIQNFFAGFGASAMTPLGKGNAEDDVTVPDEMLKNNPDVEAMSGVSVSRPDTNPPSLLPAQEPPTAPETGEPVSPIPGTPVAPPDGTSAAPEGVAEDEQPTTQIPTMVDPEAEATPAPTQDTDAQINAVSSLAGLAETEGGTAAEPTMYEDAAKSVLGIMSDENLQQAAEQAQATDNQPLARMVAEEQQRRGAVEAPAGARIPSVDQDAPTTQFRSSPAPQGQDATQSFDISSLRAPDAGTRPTVMPPVVGPNSVNNWDMETGLGLDEFGHALVTVHAPPAVAEEIKRTGRISDPNNVVIADGVTRVPKGWVPIQASVRPEQLARAAVEGNGTTRYEARGGEIVIWGHRRPQQAQQIAGQNAGEGVIQPYTSSVNQDGGGLDHAGQQAAAPLWHGSSFLGQVGKTAQGLVEAIAQRRYAKSIAVEIDKHFAPLKAALARLTGVQQPGSRFSGLAWTPGYKGLNQLPARGGTENQIAYNIHEVLRVALNWARNRGIEPWSEQFKVKLANDLTITITHEITHDEHNDHDDEFEAGNKALLESPEAQALQGDILAMLDAMTPESQADWEADITRLQENNTDGLDTRTAADEPTRTGDARPGAEQSPERGELPEGVSAGRDEPAGSGRDLEGSADRPARPTADDAGVPDPVPADPEGVDRHLYDEIKDAIDAGELGNRGHALKPSMLVREYGITYPEAGAIIDALQAEGVLDERRHYNDANAPLRQFENTMRKREPQAEADRRYLREKGDLQEMEARGPLPDAEAESRGQPVDLPDDPEEAYKKFGLTRGSNMEGVITELAKAQAASPDGYAHLTGEELVALMPGDNDANRAFDRPLALDDIRYIAKTGMRYADWYYDYMREFESQYGQGTAREFAMINAILSAQLSVELHTRGAIQVMTAMRQSLLADPDFLTLTGTTSPLRTKKLEVDDTIIKIIASLTDLGISYATEDKLLQVANAYVYGEAFRAQKVASFGNNFWHAFMRTLDRRTTNDVWEARIYGASKASNSNLDKPDRFGFAKVPGPFGKENAYDWVSAIQLWLAEEMGVVPSRMQAGIWTPGMMLWPAAKSRDENKRKILAGNYEERIKREPDFNFADAVRDAQERGIFELPMQKGSDVLNEDSIVAIRPALQAALAQMPTIGHSQDMTLEAKTAGAADPVNPAGDAAYDAAIRPQAPRVEITATLEDLEMKGLYDPETETSPLIVQPHSFVTDGESTHLVLPQTNRETASLWAAILGTALDLPSVRVEQAVFTGETISGLWMPSEDVPEAKLKTITSRLNKAGISTINDGTVLRMVPSVVTDPEAFLSNVMKIVGKAHEELTKATGEEYMAEEADVTAPRAYRSEVRDVQQADYADTIERLRYRHVTRERSDLLDRVLDAAGPAYGREYDPAYVARRDQGVLDPWGDASNAASAADAAFGEGYDGPRTNGRDGGDAADAAARGLASEDEALPPSLMAVDYVPERKGPKPKKVEDTLINRILDLPVGEDMPVLSRAAGVANANVKKAYRAYKRAVKKAILDGYQAPPQAPEAVRPWEDDIVYEVQDEIELADAPQEAAMVEEKVGKPASNFLGIQGASDIKDIIERPESEGGLGGLIPTGVIKELLKTREPYLDRVMAFMLERRAQTLNGGVKARDLAKAYFMTVTSQGSAWMQVDSFQEKMAALGVEMDVRELGRQVSNDPDFFLEKIQKEIKSGKHKGKFYTETYLRPEEAAAAWLFTPMGQQALDAMERGDFDYQAWLEGATVRLAYGDDRMYGNNVLGERNGVDPTLKAVNLVNLPQLVEHINGRIDAEARTGLDVDEQKVSDILSQEIVKLQGVATGKVGFVAQLFGFSDVPTLDAVALNAWITGKGKAEFNEANDLRENVAAASKEWISDKSLAVWLRDQVADGYRKLRDEGFEGAQDIPEAIFQNIMHHMLWDRAKGDLQTTHKGMHAAQTRALESNDETWTTEVTPEEFVEIRDRNTITGFVTPSTADDMRAKQLFIKGTEENGYVGFALDNGDLENVFSVPGTSGKKTRGAGIAAIIEAVKRGAATLDCFDDFLPQYYHQFGFVETGRLPFNREFAPPGWDYAKYGEPDVVLMAHPGTPTQENDDAIAERVGRGRATWAAGPRAERYDDWDAAADARDTFLAKSRRTRIADAVDAERGQGSGGAELATDPRSGQERGLAELSPIASSTASPGTMPSGSNAANGGARGMASVERRSGRAAMTSLVVDEDEIVASNIAEINEKYSGDMGEITVKELLQNSIDASREIPGARTTVSLFPQENAIYMADQGTGMPADVVKNEFTKFRGTKKPAGSSGGKGTAKTAFLGRSKSVIVRTVARLDNGEYEETLAWGDADKYLRPSQGLHVESGPLGWVDDAIANDTLPEAVTELGLDIQAPWDGQRTGTRIEVQLKDDVTWNKKNSGFSRSPMHNWIDSFLATNHLGSQSVEFLEDGKPFESKDVSDYSKAPTKYGTIERDNYTIDFYASEVMGETESPYVRVQNAGLFQIGMSVKLPNASKMPYMIVANVTSKVGAKDSRYPWSSDRMRVINGANDDIEDFVIHEIYGRIAGAAHAEYMAVLRTGRQIPDGTGKLYDTTDKSEQSQGLMQTLFDRPYLRVLNKALTALHDMMGEVLEGQEWGVYEGGRFESSVFGGFGTSAKWLGLNVHAKDLGVGKDHLILTNPWAKLLAMLQESHESEKRGTMTRFSTEAASARGAANRKAAPDAGWSRAWLEEPAPQGVRMMGGWYTYGEARDKIASMANGIAIDKKAGYDKSYWADDEKTLKEWKKSLKAYEDAAFRHYVGKLVANPDLRVVPPASDLFTAPDFPVSRNNIVGDIEYYTNKVKEAKQAKDEWGEKSYQGYLDQTRNQLARLDAAEIAVAQGRKDVHGLEPSVTAGYTAYDDPLQLVDVINSEVAYLGYLRTSKADPYAIETEEARIADYQEALARLARLRGESVADYQTQAQQAAQSGINPTTVFTPQFLEFIAMSWLATMQHEFVHNAVSEHKRAAFSWYLTHSIALTGGARFRDVMMKMVTDLNKSGQLHQLFMDAEGSLYQDVQSATNVFENISSNEEGVFDGPQQLGVPDARGVQVDGRGNAGGLPEAGAPERLRARGSVRGGPNGAVADAEAVPVLGLPADYPGSTVGGADAAAPGDTRGSADDARAARGLISVDEIVNEGPVSQDELRPSRREWLDDDSIADTESRGMASEDEIPSLVPYLDVPELPHYDLEKSRARVAKHGNPAVRDIALDYVRNEMGLDSIPETRYLANDPDAQRGTADWYDRTPDDEDGYETRAAYAALVDGILRQAEYLRDAGYTFTPFDGSEGDPYANLAKERGTKPSEEMRRDVRENKHLFVYGGENEPNPLMTADENWIFRGVHDLFGHAANGYDFGQRGELNAAIEHAKMFPRAALPALFNETHGQNSWVNFGPNSHLPVADRPYADQKGMAMPEEHWPPLEFDSRARGMVAGEEAFAPAGKARVDIQAAVPHVDAVRKAVVQIYNDMLDQLHADGMEMDMPFYNTALSESLLTGQYADDGVDRQNALLGLCAAAADATRYLLERDGIKLTPMVKRRTEADGSSWTHRWLQDREGRIVDPTADQFNTPEYGWTEDDYATGRAAGFMSQRRDDAGRQMPSQQAEQIADIAAGIMQMGGRVWRAMPDLASLPEYAPEPAARGMAASDEFDPRKYTTHYHGTTADFPSFDPDKLDNDADFGPAAYMTSAPGGVSDLYSRGEGGNIRPILLPKRGLKLINGDRPLPDDDVDAVNAAFGGSPLRYEWKGYPLPFDLQYEALTRAKDGDKRAVNDILSQLGFDGVRWRYDTEVDGRAVKAQATAVFPGSLDKIRNGFTGEARGMRVVDDEYDDDMRAAEESQRLWNNLIADQDQDRFSDYEPSPSNLISPIWNPMEETEDERMERESQSIWNRSLAYDDARGMASPDPLDGDPLHEVGYGYLNAAGLSEGTSDIIAQFAEEARQYPEGVSQQRISEEVAARMGLTPKQARAKWAQTDSRSLSREVQALRTGLVGALDKLTRDQITRLRSDPGSVTQAEELDSMDNLSAVTEATQFLISGRRAAESIGRALNQFKWVAWAQRGRKIVESLRSFENAVQQAAIALDALASGSPLTDRQRGNLETAASHLDALAENGWLEDDNADIDALLQRIDRQDSLSPKDESEGRETYGERIVRLTRVEREAQRVDDQDTARAARAERDNLLRFITQSVAERARGRNARPNTAASMTEKMLDALIPDDTRSMADLGAGDIDPEVIRRAWASMDRTSQRKLESAMKATTDKNDRRRVEKLYAAGEVLVESVVNGTNTVEDLDAIFTNLDSSPLGQVASERLQWLLRTRMVATANPSVQGGKALTKAEQATQRKLYRQKRLRAEKRAKAGLRDLLTTASAQLTREQGDQARSLIDRIVLFPNEQNLREELDGVLANLPSPALADRLRRSLDAQLRLSDTKGRKAAERAALRQLAALLRKEAREDASLQSQADLGERRNLSQQAREAARRSGSVVASPQMVARVKAIKEQLTAQGDKGKTQRERLNKSLVKSGLVRYLGKAKGMDDDQLEQAMKMLASIDPNKPEQVGQLMKILRHGTAIDRLIEWTYISRLSGISTWFLTGINMTANAMSVGALLGYRMPAMWLMDAASVMLRGGERNIRLEDLGAAYKGVGAALMPAAASALSTWWSGYNPDDIDRAATLGDTSGLNQEYITSWLSQYKIGNSDLSPLGAWAHRLSTRPLQAGDVFFQKLIETSVMHELAQAKSRRTGVPAETILMNLADHPEIMDEMTHRSEYTLLKSKTAWTRSFQLLTQAQTDKASDKDLAMLARGVLTMMIPFVRVPVNQAKQGFEYTAPGAVYALARQLPGAISEYNKAEDEDARYMAERHQSDILAKAVGGMALTAMAVTLYAAGAATGDGPDDPIEYDNWLLNYKPRSIWNPITKEWVSYDGLPIAIPFASTINAMDRATENIAKKRAAGTLTTGDLGMALLAGGGAGMKGYASAIANSTWAKGAARALELVSDSSRREYSDIVTDIAVDQVGALVPNIITNMAGVFDQYERAAKTWDEKIKKRLPGLRGTLDIDRDILGRPKANDRAGIIKTALLPFPRRSTDTATPQSRLLEDVGLNLTRAPKALAVDGTKSSFDLTPQEQRRYTELAGGFINSALGDYTKSTEWLALQKTLQGKNEAIRIEAEAAFKKAIVVPARKAAKDAVMAEVYADPKRKAEADRQIRARRGLEDAATGE